MREKSVDGAALKSRRQGRGIPFGTMFTPAHGRLESADHLPGGSPYWGRPAVPTKRVHGSFWPRGHRRIAAAWNFCSWRRRARSCATRERRNRNRVL